MRSLGEYSPKSNRRDAFGFGRYLYHAQDLVEQFYNKIKPVGAWMCSQ